jgi:Fusaric acid resistance protein family
MLALAGQQLPDTQADRRELIRRIIALDPMIDQALGESSYVRDQSAILQSAVHGLFKALEGWHGIATHLSPLPDDLDRQGMETILQSVPPELQSAWQAGSPTPWMADPMALRRLCEEAVRALLALPAGTPSLQLLADEAAKVLTGMVHALDGLALLVDAPGRSPPGHRGFRLSVPDWLPALVNAVRAFLAIGAVELFWVATAWPNGASAIVFVAVVVLMLSPRGDLAFGTAFAFALGIGAAVVCAAIIKFAVLPALQTFPGFCGALNLFLIPAGFAIARSRQPATVAVFTALGMNFMPLLAPTNPMSYDTAQFYNSALAIVVGCSVAPLAFRLLPQLSPAVRACRLLDLALRDLRRLAITSLLPRSEDWEGRIYGRLAALPEQAEPLHRARVLAALSVGSGIIQVRHSAPPLAVAEFDAALAALAQGNSAIAIARLRQLDRRLASAADAGPMTTAMALRARGRILLISKCLPNMPLTSTWERSHEVDRDQRVRCLRCAHLAADARSLARHHSTAPDRQPLRAAAIRLASGAVRVCRVHHRSLDYDFDRRTLRCHERYSDAGEIC